MPDGAPVDKKTADLQKILALLAQLGDKTFQIGEVQFEAFKLLPMEQYQLLNELRTGFREAATVDLPDDNDEESMTQVGFQALFLAFSTMPPALVEKVRRELFKRVSFKRPNSPTPLTLSGNEELAFDGLEGFHVMEVLARAFAVNFFGSLAGLSSLAGGATTTSNPFEPET